jgi:hypothetical protein
MHPMYRVPNHLSIPARFIAIPPSSDLLLCLVLALLFAVASARGTATITGAISDAGGKVVAGASVMLAQKETGLRRQVMTNERGNYVAPSQPISSYQLVLC